MNGNAAELAACLQRRHAIDRVDYTVGMSDIEILLASSNPHKVEEIRAVLAPLGIHVIGLDALETRPTEPVEDGETFADNARIKAVQYAQQTGRICLADDSGLEVDALDGRPGVYSARYAGVDGSRDQRDTANNQKLLDELKSVPDNSRTARFVCAMCLADPQGNVLAETRGTFEGSITRQPRGKNGFGYDPLLQLPDDPRTSAELAPEEKNARSHRGEATRRMAEQIKTRRPQLEHTQKT